MNMRSSFLAASAAIVCATLALGCSDSSSPATAPTGAAPPAQSPPAATRTVDIEDFRFGPSSVTVAAGTVVTWRNNGPSTHTSTSDDGVWASGNLGSPGGGIYEDGAGGEFGQVFSEAGTFKYHCSIHPQMKGTITVTD